MIQGRLPVNKERLSNLQEKKELLSDWERAFLESVGSQFDKKGNLSARQVETLEKIEKKVSPEAMNAREQWIENYTQIERSRAKVIAEYYKKTEYFQSLVRSILEDPEFVPEEEKYKKMANNKYALRVLTEYYAEPKYPNGSLVNLRTTADYLLRSGIGDKHCVVIASGNQVGISSSSAKGAKLYKILPFGCAKIFQVEERFIKKAKKSKEKEIEKTLDNDILF
jgi:hypothetical protein